MTKKAPDATPTPGSAAAHKIEIDRLTLQNQRLETRLEIATDELKKAKTALKRIANDYDVRVKNMLKLDIQGALECDDTELARITNGLSIDQLEAMLNTVLLAKPDRKPGEPGIFKPIRTGAAEPKEYGDMSDILTTGDLFNKTPKEIREMGGKF